MGSRPGARARVPSHGTAGRHGEPAEPALGRPNGDGQVAARTGAQLRSTLTILDRADAAIVLLEGDRAVVATPSARRLLRRYFGADIGRLLEAVSRDRSKPGARVVVVDGSEGSLVVRATDAALLLEEQRSSLLTPRERQILLLVGDGKTNAQIADELWISPGTVRRHLENAFAKLGVHTRTAAAAFVRSSHALPEAPASVSKRTND